MNDPRTPRQSEADRRDARLKAALKANMAKRKAQSRGKSASGAVQDAPEDTDPKSSGPTAPGKDGVDDAT